MAAVRQGSHPPRPRLPTHETVTQRIPGLQKAEHRTVKKPFLQHPRHGSGGRSMPRLLHDGPSVPQGGDARPLRIGRGAQHVQFAYGGGVEVVQHPSDGRAEVGRRGTAACRQQLGGTIGRVRGGGRGGGSTQEQPHASRHVRQRSLLLLRCQLRLAPNQFLEPPQSRLVATVDHLLARHGLGKVREQQVRPPEVLEAQSRKFSVGRDVHLVSGASLLEELDGEQRHFLEARVAVMAAAVAGGGGGMEVRRDHGRDGPLGMGAAQPLQQSVRYAVQRGDVEGKDHGGREVGSPRVEGAGGLRPVPRGRARRSRLGRASVIRGGQRVRQRFQQRRNGAGVIFREEHRRVLGEGVADLSAAPILASVVSVGGFPVVEGRGCGGVRGIGGRRMMMLLLLLK
mmetsp:Transcript_42725/g.89674  ORF Transcript_42725/g.89674 Transcript_42725/m.89674 type:complete len:398 (+) Transcript_42725:80-1273(+)